MSEAQKSIGVRGHRARDVHQQDETARPRAMLAVTQDDGFTTTPKRFADRPRRIKPSGRGGSEATRPPRLSHRAQDGDQPVYLGTLIRRQPRDVPMPQHFDSARTGDVQFTG
ncbi:hypothetical protein FHU30_003723 [Actinomadura rupiterrae]|nr:hypothetical protein [Actinomadura rupiterrae]